MTFLFQILNTFNDIELTFESALTKGLWKLFPKLFFRRFSPIFPNILLDFIYKSKRKSNEMTINLNIFLMFFISIEMF